MNRKFCGVNVFVSGETYNEYKGTLQEQIEQLQQENTQLKEQLKTKHEGFMASVEQNCEYATILIELRSWLEEDLKEKYRDAGYRNNIIREVLDKLNELEGIKDEKV